MNRTDNKSKVSKSDNVIMMCCVFVFREQDNFYFVSQNDLKNARLNRAKTQFYFRIIYELDGHRF